MKNYKNYFLLILVAFLVILSFTSCPDSVLTGENNMDEMPADLKTVAYLNYSAAKGTVVVTDTTITVTAGSSPTEVTTCALELNTSLALAAGYTIEDEYIEGDSTDLQDGGSYTLIYTKKSSPTIRYVFVIYLGSDVCIEKYEDEVLDEDFQAYFTWVNYDE